MRKHAFLDESFVFPRSFENAISTPKHMFWRKLRILGLFSCYFFFYKKKMRKHAFLDESFVFPRSFENVISTPKLDFRWQHHVLRLFLTFKNSQNKWKQRFFDDSIVFPLRFEHAISQPKRDFKLRIQVLRLFLTCKTCNFNAETCISMNNMCKSNKAQLDFLESNNWLTDW